MNSDAEKIIESLGLEPLPDEGGFFRRTYTCSQTIFGRYRCASGVSPVRSACTAIYYMMTQISFSAMHRVACDEIWHFYAGDKIRMLQLFEHGQGNEILIGSEILKGQKPQMVVPAGVWQGALPEGSLGWSLVGATVSPGFEFADFELGRREVLLGDYPEFKSRIMALTRS